MSVENKRTVEVYKKTAKEYISSSINTTEDEIIKAERKKEKLQKFIKESFSSLKKQSKILEIGSADGENAKYIEDLGFKVTPSDIAEDFLDAIKKLNLDPIKLDIVEDEIKEKYNGVFCWRVFVHFTKEDAKKVLEKVYNILEGDGIFIFNAMNREIRNVEDEWVDFEGKFHIGIDRYYNYYYQEELDNMIKLTGFNIINFHKEGGEFNNKWLVYVLKK